MPYILSWCKARVWGVTDVILTEWRVESFVDDLNTRQGIVSGRMALLQWSTKIQPFIASIPPSPHQSNPLSFFCTTRPWGLQAVCLVCRANNRLFHPFRKHGKTVALVMMVWAPTNSWLQALVQFSALPSCHHPWKLFTLIQLMPSIGLSQ